MSQEQCTFSKMSAAVAATAKVGDWNKQQAEMIALVLADCISLVPKVMQKYPEVYDEVAEVLALHTGGKIQLDDALAMMASAEQEEPASEKGGKAKDHAEGISSRVLVSRKRKPEITANEEPIKRSRNDVEEIEVDTENAAGFFSSMVSRAKNFLGSFW